MDPLHFNPLSAAKENIERSVKHSELLFHEHQDAIKKHADVTSVNFEKLQKQLNHETKSMRSKLEKFSESPELKNLANPNEASKWLGEYWNDFFQRQTLFLDTLRERGNIYLEHTKAGMPPVLDFEYEIIMDGRDFKPAVNYMLLKILPPEGTVLREEHAPIIIIDPRAGHGAGIGGFKPESQVGDGFADGHPVYFVAFQQKPEPNQTLADVRDAEIQFVKEVSSRHPNAPKPIIIGNCQGGWATMLIAAQAPEICGPLIINGAPMSYWAGKRGENPMRYLGGVRGGALPAILMSDLGNGIFDGAALVQNFESLNPANSLFAKYYHLFANVDSERERFLEFERWWGGYALMTEAEIRWIVENLFIGNKLAAGEAILGHDRIDLKKIESPILVFASHGDNITPPQQALHWITDLYASADEIKAVGQRIVYMLHDSIGHLGIFVSAKVAGREHDAITDTMRAIEALSPGLYEMVLRDEDDRMHIFFEPREIEDIELIHNDAHSDDDLFAEASVISTMMTDSYERFARPFIKSMVTEESAKLMRNMNPMRTQRVQFSNQNPLMPLVETTAKNVANQRKPASPENPFLKAEKIAAELVEIQLNMYREVRDAFTEILFFNIYTSPHVKTVTRPHHKTHTRREVDVKTYPEIKAAMAIMDQGGVPEAVVRMLHLLTKARGYVRRTRLERELKALRSSLFPDLKDEEPLSKVIHQQSLIVDFEPKLAVESLPKLLNTAEKQKEALELVMDVAGPRESMHPKALKQYQQFESMFPLALSH